MNSPKPHSYASFTRHEVTFKQVKVNCLFSFQGIKYRKISDTLAKPEKGTQRQFADDVTVTIADNKHGAVQVFVDPNNYLSHRLERDSVHTLRFPSKYEYSVYAALKKYLNRVNSLYSQPRYFLELQFQITLISKSTKQQALTHVVDFVIRDSQSKINPILFIEAKGQFLREYVNKMKMMQGLKPQIYSRYLVVSDNEPSKGYEAYYCTLKKLEVFLHAMGVR